MANNFSYKVNSMAFYKQKLLTLDEVKKFTYMFGYTDPEVEKVSQRYCLIEKLPYIHGEEMDEDAEDYTDNWENFEQVIHFLSKSYPDQAPKFQWFLHDGLEISQKAVRLGFDFTHNTKEISGYVSQFRNGEELFNEIVNTTTALIEANTIFHSATNDLPYETTATEQVADLVYKLYSNRVAVGRFFIERFGKTEDVTKAPQQFLEGIKNLSNADIKLDQLNSYVSFNVETIKSMAKEYDQKYYSDKVKTNK